ncbi:MAG TPA: AAA family ATPase [Candidatus Paceibacterota bacterium]
MEEIIDINSLFDRRLSFPDPGALKRFSQLVGIDDTKSRVAKLLAVLVHPDGVKEWAAKHHKEASAILDFVERRPPLVILAGDVGTGKTELAETVGAAVAAQDGIDITLFPLSLSTRGSGKVGEMTKLLSAAFNETVAMAESLKTSGGKAKGAVILLVDEADALVQSRENAQMHHEDRAGVNAFIRGVDRLAQQKLPAAVILCTNRLDSIDPAVHRRAADVFKFSRPNEAQRETVMSPALNELGFNKTQINKIVKLTGETKDRAYGFTYSDLTQRLLPAFVMDAYPTAPVTFERAQELTVGISPTPPFKQS